MPGIFIFNMSERERGSGVEQDCEYFRQHRGDSHVFFYGDVRCDNIDCPNYAGLMAQVEGDGEPIGLCGTYGFTTAERCNDHFELLRRNSIASIVGSVVASKTLEEAAVTD